jgi:8-oxo-dGTP pyrophosphatase MutT (NUDIX family)
MTSDLPERLANRLKRPLPGPMEGTRFAALDRPGPSVCEIPPQAKPAAVLALLYPIEERWHVPFTLRPQHLPDHAGQVCFPGGAVEPGESLEDAAIREFHEEVGAEGVTPQIIGALSPLYVHVSNFRVDPFVAVCDRRPDFIPNPHEVDEILEVPLDHLLDPANLACHERGEQGRTYSTPHFCWQSHRIWGATCLILGELVTVIEEFASQRM